MKYFAIRELRELTILSPSVPENDLNQLIKILATSDNRQVTYEISWIIINLTYNADTYVHMLAKEDIIQALFQVLVQSTEYPIIMNLVWIFANLLSDDESIYNLIVSTTGIVDYIVKMMTNESDLPNYLKCKVLWALANILKYPNEVNFKKVYSLVPIIFKFLKSNLFQDNFSEALGTVARLCRTKNEELLKNMVNFDLIEILVNYIKSSTDLNDLDNILKILGDLAYRRERFVKLINETNFIDRIESLLEDQLRSVKNMRSIPSKDKQFIKHIIWCINNVISANIEWSRNIIVRHTKIPQYVLELEKIISDVLVVEEIVMFFALALENGSFKVKTELIRLPVLELFKKMIDLNNVDIQILALRGILHFLEFGMHLMRDKNIIKIELENEGVNSMVEKLTLNDDTTIQNLSTSIMGFFRDDSNY